MQSSEDIGAPSVEAPTGSLSADAVPIGRRSNGQSSMATARFLFDCGAVVIGTDERNFLFCQFRPRRGDLIDAQPNPAPGSPESDGPEELTVRHRHLATAALMGLRSQVGTGGPMHSCQIIGFAPNQALFATPRTPTAAFCCS